ncbi:MAG: septal ring lytic transglycosylase RlpA family protein [Magnetococcales bacterium]|nr:septal ring lytic transglycosylase RlpA family protein [Magnetococcales bacterium]
MNRLRLLLLAGLLSGCGHMPGEPPVELSKSKPLVVPGPAKIGGAYTINGVTYYPRESASGYAARGVASWYGAEFHGKKTANGERFDKNALTGAHPTLPLPSLVRVTNLDNGRQALVRVNDRGPFHNNRLIDLSMGSAKALGFHLKGTALVQLEAITTEEEFLQTLAEVEASSAGEGVAVAMKSPEDDASVQLVTPQPGVEGKASRRGKRPSAPEVELEEGAATPFIPPKETTSGRGPAAAPVRVVAVTKPPKIFVQLGAFQDGGNARKLADKVKSLAEAEVNETLVDNQKFHRVRIGPVDSVVEADALVDKLAKKGFGKSRIIVE